MSMDADWMCECGHTNPDFSDRCDGCGQERYSEPLELPSEHAHRCEMHNCLDTRVCLGRGYHECTCGATCGISTGASVWIKSHAVADPFKFLDAYPFRFSA